MQAITQVIRYLAETPSSHSVERLYIYNIAVKTEYQKKGYGTILLKAVEELAMADGVKTIDLNVWSFNQEGREFLFKRGFVSLNETMTIRVSS